jgi:hypothetical protein
MKDESTHSDSVSASDAAMLKATSEVACGVRPLQFTKVESYTTFTAEYAWDGGDVVFHFYRAPEHSASYWLEKFPTALDPIARDLFQAGPPRLRAAYTDEMDSWWMRANGFSHLVDKDAFISRFLQRLDQTLDTMSST